MIEISSKNKNFDKLLDNFLSKRRKKLLLSSVSVSRIINDVRKNGDKAVLKYERKFNKNNIIVPSPEQINNSIRSLDKKIKKAIDDAYERIYKFHSLQKFKNISFKDKYNNKIDYKHLPLESVGIYVPGSTASYPSSVLMSAIPAIVAKVKRIVMINPGYKGNQNPAVLYAARRCGIKEIYSIGGPSAIAAAAYGTKSIKPVNKIVGPGNSYVAAAKKVVSGDIGIDAMTGPSEILIIADKTSNPEWIASDLIGQAEHDPLAQCILISKDRKILEQTKKEIFKQLKEIPRSSIAQKSLMINGILMYVNSDTKIIEISNKISPEHLEIHVKNYKSYIPKIKNAGSVCYGTYAVMACTDYGLPGTNHILPVNGSAKYSSGLGVSEFIKKISFINLSKKSIETTGPSIINFANFEGLQAHAKSIEKRIRRK